MTVYKDFSFVSRPATNVGAMQAVATDGTYIYVTSGGTAAPENNLRLYKYDSAYTEIAHHDCGPDAPNAIMQANGIFWHPTYDRLFVTGNNWNGAGGAQSTILEYDTNLTFLRAHAPSSGRSMEMIVEHDGYWWAIYTDQNTIDQFQYDDAAHTFTLIKTHTLPGRAPGDSSISLWQAILWLGDTAYLNAHGTNPWAPFIVAYRWTGATFELVAAGLQPPTVNCTQGVSLAPDGATLLWAERIPVSGNYQGNVVTSGFAEGGTKVLDYFRHACGGFGLRKLYSGYTGSAIQIRRSLDDAQLDIGFDANGDLDESTLLALVGSGDAFVAIFYNQANGLHPTIAAGGDLAQAAAAEQPQIVSAGTVLRSNGKPALFFDASKGDNLLATGGVNYSQPNIFFATANSTASAAGRQYIFDGDVTGAGNTTDQRHVLALNNSGLNAQWAGTWLAGGAYALGPQQHTALFNGAISYHRVDGTQAASGDVGAGQFRFGSLGSNYNGSQDWFNGYIGELLWVPDTLDSASVGFIEADQAGMQSATAALIAEAAQASDAYAAQALAMASWNDATQAAAGLAPIARGAAAITESVLASESDGELAQALALLTGPASGNALIDALGQVSAALAAGTAAGEAWAAQANVLADLVVASAAGDVLSVSATQALQAAISEPTQASSAFVAAIAAIAQITAPASAAAQFDVTSAAAPRGAIVESAAATDALIATVSVLVTLGAGAGAHDTWSGAAAALDTQLNEMASAAARLDAQIAIHASMQASGYAGDTWLGALAQITGVFTSLVRADSIVAARAAIVAVLTNRVIAGSMFDARLPGNGYLIAGAITLTAAISGTITLKPN